MGFLDNIEGALGSAAGAVTGAIGSAVNGVEGALGSAVGAVGAELAGIGGDIDQVVGGIQGLLGLGTPDDPNQPLSVARNSLNVGGLDPIQGYDVGVWVEDIGRGHQQVLLGQFTSILVTVKNASEPYMPVGSRQPIYLDGEMQIAFTLEKGLLDALVFQETFGFRGYDFNNRYFRSPRFKITFAMDPVDWWALDEPTQTFDGVQRRTPAGRLVLDICKIDAWQLGARAGKDVVATQWTGVAQQIYAEPHTQRDLSDERSRLFSVEPNNLGNPHSPQRVSTFKYNRLAQTATTTPLPAQRSYAEYNGIDLNMILSAERQAILGIKHLGIPGVDGVLQAALDSIDQIQAQNGGTAGGDNFPGRRSSNDGTGSIDNSMVVTALLAQRNDLLQLVSQQGLDTAQLLNIQTALATTTDQLRALGKEIPSFAIQQSHPERLQQALSDQQELLAELSLINENADGHASAQRGLKKFQLQRNQELIDRLQFGGTRSSNDEEAGDRRLALALAQRAQLTQELQQVQAGGPIPGSNLTVADKRAQLDQVNKLVDRLTEEQQGKRSYSDGLGGTFTNIALLRASRQGLQEQLQTATGTEAENLQFALNQVNSQLAASEEPRSSNDHFASTDGGSPFGLGAGLSHESYNDSFIPPPANTFNAKNPASSADKEPVFDPKKPPAQANPFSATNPSSHIKTPAELAADLAALLAAGGTPPVAVPTPPDPKSHIKTKAELAADLAALLAAGGKPPAVPPVDPVSSADNEPVFDPKKPPAPGNPFAPGSGNPRSS